MKYSYNPPRIIKKIFRDYQWNSVSQKILLTFDDGPNPNTTETILSELNKLSLKTIFFCVGENIDKYPSIVKEILSEGHEIGNHTQKHQKITQLDELEIAESIKKVQDIALEKFNYQIKFFRPPYGRFTFRTNRILNDFDLQNVMWSLLTYDYKNDLNIVKFALTKYLTDNSIIVLHDSDKSKDIIVDSIRSVVEEVEKRNYKIGSPSECLKYSS